MPLIRPQNGDVSRTRQWVWPSAQLAVAGAWLIGNELRSPNRFSGVVLHGSPGLPADVLMVVLWGVPVIIAALLLNTVRMRWRGLGIVILTLATVGMVLTALLWSTSDSVFVSGGGAEDNPQSIVHLLPLLAVLAAGWALTGYLRRARSVNGPVASI
jgi:hypothetical protein